MASWLPVDRDGASPLAKQIRGAVECLRTHLSKFRKGKIVRRFGGSRLSQSAHQCVIPPGRQQSLRGTIPHIDAAAPNDEVGRPHFCRQLKGLNRGAGDSRIEAQDSAVDLVEEIQAAVISRIDGLGAVLGSVLAGIDDAHRIVSGPVQEAFHHRVVRCGAGVRQDD